MHALILVAVFLLSIPVQVLALKTKTTLSCPRLLAPPVYEQARLDRSLRFVDYKGRFGKPVIYTQIGALGGVHHRLQTVYAFEMVPKELQEISRAIWSESFNPLYVQRELERLPELRQQTSDPAQLELKANAAIKGLMPIPGVEVRGFQFVFKTGQVRNFYSTSYSVLYSGGVTDEVLRFMRAHGHRVKSIRDIHSHLVPNTAPSKGDQSMEAWFRAQMKKLNLDVAYDVFVVTTTSDNQLILFKLGAVAKTF